MRYNSHPSPTGEGFLTGSHMFQKVNYGTHNLMAIKNNADARWQKLVSEHPYLEDLLEGYHRIPMVRYDVTSNGTLNDDQAYLAVKEGLVMLFDLFEDELATILLSADPLNVITIATATIYHADPQVCLDAIDVQSSILINILHRMAWALDTVDPATAIYPFVSQLPLTPNYLVQVMSILYQNLHAVKLVSH